MYLSYNGAFRLMFDKSIQYLFFLVLFMISYDINKDFNISLSFPDQATPLTFKNNLRIILSSKIEKFKNIETRKS